MQRSEEVVVMALRGDAVYTKRRLELYEPRDGLRVELFDPMRSAAELPGARSGALVAGSGFASLAGLPSW